MAKGWREEWAPEREGARGREVGMGGGGDGREGRWHGNGRERKREMERTSEGE